MNSRSLSFRLVTWYAGLLTVVFVLLGALTFYFLRHYLEANLLDIQARRARQIAYTLLAGIPGSSEAVVAKQVEVLYSPEVNDRFIRITRADGEVVYGSGFPRDNSFDPTRVPLPPLARNGEFYRKESLSRGELLLAAVTYGGAGSPRYVVEVGVSNLRTEGTLRQMLIMMAIGLPIAVCFAVTGGFVLVRRALKPVEQIAHKAEDITQHNLSQRLPVVQTGDELERLSISLNHMISRLEDSIQSSKQFVADASHELRTPLTVLRGELEGLAQDQQLRPPTRETLGSMLEEVDRLAEIVEGLLALSRLDAGEANSEWVPFDLAELAASTADQMSLLAEDKNITVICETSPGVNVEGDRARMKQVVVNLLDNAIKYTPSGGRVCLKISRDDGEAILEIADDGIGIPHEALPHVFKRFYRVDGSRSREQGGAGLGLSIVKSICAAHGAQVEVASIPGKGSRFRIRQSLVNKASVHALS
ncbi:MAG: Integral rane sensor signal transduction histidine kinase [Gammaproteobacteria bacterium]|nr:Integral rane sensor signal transduction histidine kinase [Gammaproteobacteria bacterium]